MSKQCIVNVANGGWYPAGQERLKRTLLKHGYRGDFLFWKNEYPTGSPTHQQIPYAFKTYALFEALHQGYEQVLWLDASIAAVKSIDPIFELMSRDGYALWFDRGWNVGEWCSDAALQTLRLHREESFLLSAVHACVVGLDFRREMCRTFLREWHTLANDGITFPGSWTNESQQVSKDQRVHGHRHDQTALSVLAYRYGMQPISRRNLFAYWNPKIDLRINGKLDPRVVIVSAHGGAELDESQIPDAEEGHSNVLLSILIPSSPSRYEKCLLPLCRKLERQAQSRTDVEILVIADNESRSLWLKRNALLRLSKGRYVAFLDDSDDVSDDYVEALVSSIRSTSDDVDVVVFNQQAIFKDGNSFKVTFGLEFGVEEARLQHGRCVDIKQSPSHVCAWKAVLAKKHCCHDSSLGDPSDWLKAVLPDARTQRRVDKVLHYCRITGD